MSFGANNNIRPGFIFGKSGMLQYLYLSLSTLWPSSFCHSIYPREMIVYIYQKTHKVIILAALFVIASEWKDPNFKIHRRTFIYRKQWKDWSDSILYNLIESHICNIEWEKETIMSLLSELFTWNSRAIKVNLKC